MKFLDFENVEYSLSGVKDSPTNFVGHETFDSERRANRNAFLKHSLGLSPFSTVVPKLYHGGRCEVVSAHNPIYGSIAADAILTDKKNLVLTMGFADCPTIFLYDPVAGVIGLVHAGWKSIVADIIKNTIGRMKVEFNSNPQNIQALIGPGICYKHYEIGPEVAVKFGIETPGKVLFDLNIEIDKRLRAEDLFRIFNLNECTYGENGEEKYYSWRRDRSDPLNTNMAVLIMR